jgi:hypothetical protein
MDIRKHAVEPLSRLHLRNAADELLYADGPDGEPDKSKPVAVNLYGPGSKQYAKANAVNQNRMVEKLRRKGKVDESADEKAQQAAEYLALCTHSWENMEYGDSGLQGEALSKAVYADASIGFIGDQVAAHIKEWGNFLKVSTTS